MKRISILALLAAAVAVAQNAVIRTGTNAAVDLSGATATQPARKGAGAPSGACVQGEQYFRTDATAGQNLYFCTATNNWTQMTGGGEAGNPTGATDPGTCTVGQLFFNTTGGVQKACSATNTWTSLREVVAGVGVSVSNSGSSGTVSVDTAVIVPFSKIWGNDVLFINDDGVGADDDYDGDPPITCGNFTGYVDGQVIWLRVQTANTAAARLDICNFGYKNIADSTGSTSLTNGVLSTTGLHPLHYVSAANQFRMLPQGGSSTTTDYITFRGATCQQGAAVVNFDLPTTGYPTAICVNSGSVNTAYGVFNDSVDNTVHGVLTLPVNWTGAIDLDVRWRAAATTGGVVWAVQTACVAAGEDATNPTFNSVDYFTADAAAGTTLLDNDASKTSITTTGCAAGEDLHFKFFRDGDGTGGTDDMSGDAQLKWIRFKIQRN